MINTTTACLVTRDDVKSGDDKHNDVNSTVVIKIMMTAVWL